VELFIAVLLLFLTVSLAPLVHWPLKSIDGYLLPQIGACFLGISLVTVATICVGFIPVNVTSILAIIYLVYLMTTNAWSTASHNSLRDVPLVFSYIFAFLSALVLFALDKNSIVFVSYGVTFTACATSVYGMLQSFGIDPLFPVRVRPNNVINQRRQDGVPTPTFFDKEGKDRRVIATIGNTSFFSGYLAASVPFIVYLVVNESKFFFVPLLIVLSGLALTKCRATLLGLLLSLWLFLILCARQGYILNFLDIVFGDLPLGVLILLGIFVCMCTAHALSWARKNKVGSKLSEPSRVNTLLDIEDEDQETKYAQLRYRFRYWKAALHLILQKPLQGFGLRTYRNEVYAAQAELNYKDKGRFLSACYQTPQPREVHNDYIESFVEGGAVGGLLFLSLIGVVLWHGFTISHTLPNVAFLSSIVMILVAAFFFFPLRLGPSSVLFFLLLAMLESMSGSISLVPIAISPLVVLFVVGALAAVLWEGVIKPNLGNYYFHRHSFAKTPDKKEILLTKAVTFSPKESIFRTYMMLGFIETMPEVAARHAEVLYHYYDGMTPGWTMFYNYGLSKKVKKDYADAAKYFADACYYNPRFKEAALELENIQHKVPLPKIRRSIVKNANQEAINAIRFHESEMKNLQLQLEMGKLLIASIIQSEQQKLNIPQHWVFDISTGVFLSPQEVQQQKLNVTQIGPARVSVTESLKQGGK